MQYADPANMVPGHQRQEFPAASARSFADDFPSLQWNRNPCLTKN
jgi:hypothetical protein